MVVLARLALGLSLAGLTGTVACTPAQAPTARKVGKVMAIGGVGGLIASSMATHLTSNTEELIISFSVISGGGIGLFAAGEMTAPPGPRPETLPERHRRWAKILTERAAGAARDGRCARVRRLEGKVRMYDPEVHDFVLMRDPEIVKCLTEPGTPPPPPVTEHPPSEAPTAPEAGQPSPPSPDPSAPSAPIAPAP